MKRKCPEFRVSNHRINSTHRVLTGQHFDLILQLCDIFFLFLPADTSRLSVLDHSLLPLEVPQLLSIGVTTDCRSAGDQGRTEPGGLNRLGLDKDGPRALVLIADQHQGGRGPGHTGHIGTGHQGSRGGHHWPAQLGDGHLTTEAGAGQADGVHGRHGGLAEECVHVVDVVDAVDAVYKAQPLHGGEGWRLVLAAGARGARLGLDAGVRADPGVCVAGVGVEVVHDHVVQHPGLQALEGGQEAGAGVTSGGRDGGNVQLRRDLGQNVIVILQHVAGQV